MVVGEVRGQVLILYKVCFMLRLGSRLALARLSGGKKWLSAG